MNVCGLTRLVVPAFVVGLAVATVAGNDGYGWIAAGLTAGSLYVVQRVRRTGLVCSISSPTRTTEAGTSDREADPLPPR